MVPIALSTGLFLGGPVCFFIFYPKDYSKNPETRIGDGTYDGRLYGVSIFLLNIRQDQTKGDTHCERKGIREGQGIFQKWFQLSGIGFLEFQG